MNRFTLTPIVLSMVAFAGHPTPPPVPPTAPKNVQVEYLTNYIGMLRRYLALVGFCLTGIWDFSMSYQIQVAKTRPLNQDKPDVMGFRGY
jgi:hypothetical protein